MKIKKMICAVIAAVIAAVSLSGCMIGEASDKRDISRRLGIDCSKAKVTEKYDSHGGFHGDGTSFYALQFDEDWPDEKISRSDNWRAFPLSDNAVSILWGWQTEERSDFPMIIRDNDWNKPLFPRIEHGYWFFLDRHSFAADPRDDSHVLDESRPSYNFTIAVYDTDHHTLYYSEFDT